MPIDEAALGATAVAQLFNSLAVCAEALGVPLMTKKGVEKARLKPIRPFSLLRKIPSANPLIIDLANLQAEHRRLRDEWTRINLAHSCALFSRRTLVPGGALAAKAFDANDELLDDFCEQLIRQGYTFGARSQAAVLEAARLCKLG